MSITHNNHSHSGNISSGNISFSGMNDVVHLPLSPPNLLIQQKALHRLAAVREREGISRRTIARQLHLDLDVVKQQEKETSDLPLSMIYQWQKLLGVPVAELLVDAADDSLAPIVRQRAQLVRIMKTAKAILERANQTSVRRIAQTLVDQLIELMPELQDVSAWHVVGQRRRLDEFGRAAQWSVDSGEWSAENE